MVLHLHSAILCFYELPRGRRALCLSRHNRHCRSNHNLAFSLRERKDFKDALSEYQRVLEIDKNYPHTFASIGDVYLQLGSSSAALTAYEQAIFQNPNDIAALLNIAMVYQSVGAMNEAEAAYQRIIKINPMNTAAHVDLGVLYMKEITISPS
jgi:protein O-mannosyl-transferase